MAPESLSPLILDANAHMRGVLRAILPVIMVTACSERSRVIEAVKAGVDEFLVKAHRRGRRRQSDERRGRTPPLVHRRSGILWAGPPQED